MLVVVKKFDKFLKDNEKQLKMFEVVSKVVLKYEDCALVHISSYQGEELKFLQFLVEGKITLGTAGDLKCYCNDEGLLMSLPIEGMYFSNKPSSMPMVAGNYVLIKDTDDNGDTSHHTVEDIKTFPLLVYASVN